MVKEKMLRCVKYTICAFAMGNKAGENVVAATTAPLYFVDSLKDVPSLKAIPSFGHKLDLSLENLESIFSSKEGRAMDSLKSDPSIQQQTLIRGDISTMDTRKELVLRGKGLRFKIDAKYLDKVQGVLRNIFLNVMKDVGQKKGFGKVNHMLQYDDSYVESTFAKIESSMKNLGISGFQRDDYSKDFSMEEVGTPYRNLILCNDIEMELNFSLSQQKMNPDEQEELDAFHHSNFYYLDGSEVVIFMPTKISYDIPTKVQHLYAVVSSHLDNFPQAIESGPADIQFQHYKKTQDLEVILQEYLGRQSLIYSPENIVSQNSECIIYKSGKQFYIVQYMGIEEEFINLVNAMMQPEMTSRKEYRDRESENAFLKLLESHLESGLNKKEELHIKKKNKLGLMDRFFKIYNGEGYEERLQRYKDTKKQALEAKKKKLKENNKARKAQKAQKKKIVEAQNKLQQERALQKRKAAMASK